VCQCSVFTVCVYQALEVVCTPLHLAQTWSTAMAQLLSAMHCLALLCLLHQLLQRGMYTAYNVIWLICLYPADTQFNGHFVIIQWFIINCLSLSADNWSSVLWRCWLGGRKGIRPVKNLSGGCWHGYLSGARCRLAYGPADDTATHYLFSKIQIGFTFLVPAHPGSPEQRAIKRVCVFQ